MASSSPPDPTQPAPTPPASTEPRPSTSVHVAGRSRSRGEAPYTSSYHPAPASNRTIGEPLVIPAAHAGTEEIPPGEWAEYAFSVPWKVARDRQSIKKPTIDTLTSMPMLREPFARESKRWTGGKMNEQIGQKVCRVESLLIVIREKGPWALCVRLPGTNPVIKGCANCHYDNGDSGCEFPSRHPPARTPTRLTPALIATRNLRLGQRRSIDLGSIRDVHSTAVAIEQDFPNLVRSIERLQDFLQQTVDHDAEATERGAATVREMVNDLAPHRYIETHTDQLLSVTEKLRRDLRTAKEVLADIRSQAEALRTADREIVGRTEGWLQR
ncbi:hypothetical protein N7456_007420 [Penicillium angulare]|uniref:Uncharacterized protein n=1 Tax=Penicillium angulare TaxID=116970 RepID=A0A9W9FAN4_9EURO|nr:hypothetical protein N7456_007420 [Penicillium angulare]